MTGNGTFRTANIILTGNNTIEFQSGDVVGYYHPLQSRYRVRTIQTDGYIQYQFTESPAPISVDLKNANSNDNGRQLLIQFTIGKYAFNQAQLRIIKNDVHVAIYIDISYSIIV